MDRMTYATETLERMPAANMPSAVIIIFAGKTKIAATKERQKPSTDISKNLSAPGRFFRINQIPNIALVTSETSALILSRVNALKKAV